MKRVLTALTMITTLLVLLQQCTTDVKLELRTPLLPATPYSYDTPVAQSFFNPYGDSVINNHVATLGRVLFYDTQLSHNNRTSCGTCHQQLYGFADNTQWSLGFLSGLTGRNTQTIVNTGTQIGFFWDLREATLDHMVLQPIANHVEMGIPDTLYMEEKVRRTDYYNQLFINAFGNDEVTTNKIGRALAQFVKSIISVSSKFDKGRLLVDPDSQLGNAANHIDFPNYTVEENLGKEIFFLKFPCSTCHGGVNLDGSLSRPFNIGLEVDYTDNGMRGYHNPSPEHPDSVITQVPMMGSEVADGFFKTPSLRNISLTGPYMHDGRFKTLEEVVEFYNSGIQPHLQLSQTLRKHSDGGLFEFGPPIPEEEEMPGRKPLRMYMTSEEKAAIVAFLKTLTDSQVVSDPKFNDPFAY